MTTRMKLPVMEGTAEIQQTLSEIDRRTPNALRAAFRLGYKVLSPPIDGKDLDDFVASVLPPPVSEDRDHHRTELDELPFAREHCFWDVPEGEDVDAPRRALRMDSASCYVPASDHDAHFEVADIGVIGVADGVSGYSKLGVDAGAFSRTLMRIARREALATARREPICPYTLLEKAHYGAVVSGTPGGSTAVVLSLVGDKLRWANLGDSGFAVLRGGTVVHRSQPQYSRFRCPFQLAAKGGSSITTAEVGETPVKEGDIVVVATDGLFDNMFNADLERVVRMGTALGFSPKNMADIIAGIAFEMSLSAVKDSPYSVALRKRQQRAPPGGKLDDITVVVAFIGSTTPEPSMDKIVDDVTPNWMDEVNRKKMERERKIRPLPDASSSLNPGVRTGRIRAPPLAPCRARALGRRPAVRSKSARRARW